MTIDINTVVLNANASLSQPDVARLTTQSLDGTGVFDILMRTAQLHLTREYDADRITGAEYANVYLGLVTVTFQSSLQFLLNSQQEDKIQAEIALTRQRTVTELANTDNDIPIGLGFNGDTQVEGLVALQREKLTQEGLLVDAQVKHTSTEVDLTGQQVVTELAKTGDDFTQAAVNGYGFNTITSLEGLLKTEQDKTKAEVVYTEQRTVTELANTSDTKPSDLGEMVGTTAINGLVDSQKSKVAAETTLMAQKANTELANTSDAVLVGLPYLNNLTSVTGVMGKQKSLYTAQTDGFARDAEQKVLKIVADTWSVSATQSAATANAVNKLDDASLGAIVSKAKEGIGV